MTRFMLFLARKVLGRSIIVWVFRHMNKILPLKRLHETDTLISFLHPKPSYPVHILLVPKKLIGDLFDLKQEDNEFLQDVFRMAQILVEEFDLTKTGYRLILNGGEFQEVPQLHFHLIGGRKE